MGTSGVINFYYLSSVVTNAQCRTINIFSHTIALLYTDKQKKNRFEVRMKHIRKQLNGITREKKHLKITNSNEI